MPSIVSDAGGAATGVRRIGQVQNHRTGQLMFLIILHIVSSSDCCWGDLGGGDPSGTRPPRPPRVSVTRFAIAFASRAYMAARCPRQDSTAMHRRGVPRWSLRRGRCPCGMQRIDVHRSDHHRSTFHFHRKPVLSEDCELGKGEFAVIDEGLDRRGVHQ